MAIDQRQKRASILDQRAVGGRGIDRRTPTYRGEFLHYSDKYGTSMDDRQLEYMDKQQSKFRQGINKAKSQLAKSRANVESAYTSGKDKILSQQFNAPGFKAPSYDDVAKEKGVAVRFFDEQQQLGTHYMSPEAAKNYMSSLESAGHDYYGSADDEIGGYWVNVKGYGKEMHHPVAELEAASRDEYNRLVAAKQGQYNEQVAVARAAFEKEKSGALSILDRDYGVAQERLSSQQRSIQKSIKANNNALNTIRNKYAKKLEGVESTIQALFANKGKGNGK